LDDDRTANSKPKLIDVKGENPYKNTGVKTNF
jgi:hypothetical protein